MPTFFARLRLLHRSVKCLDDLSSRDNHMRTFGTLLFYYNIYEIQEELESVDYINLEKGGLALYFIRSII